MKPKILYVDDEPENTIVFEASFEDDFDILLAATGSQALEILEQTPVAVLVADQRMPGMTGVELCEIARHKQPHTKRIILTGYSDSAAMLDAINKGHVFHFLTKPWDRNELFAALLRAVEAHELSMTNTALTERLLASQRLATLGKAVVQIAHEIGNQVLISPLIEMIEQRYRDRADLIKMARLVARSNESLRALVAEIKDFVRHQGSEMVSRPIRLAEALHELVSFLRFDKNIPDNALCLEIRAEPEVLGSKVKIQQVLVNLLKNAADAIRDRPGGRIELVVEVDERHALLRVTDNGCGMSAETQSRIWEPFFTTKGSEGTGLGLDICRQLIELHEGQIECDSVPDEGTTFTIRLPLCPDGDGLRDQAGELLVEGATC